jgi:hypothetical protein
MKSFKAVWKRILKYDGSIFHTIENKPFSYVVKGKVLKPVGKNREIPQNDIETAYGMLPIWGSGKVNQIVQGASYVWGILNDPRIVGQKVAISNTMGKYVPLKRFLEAAPKSQKSVTLSFAQVEVILRDTLPPSARNRRQWWANDETHVQARAWLVAGFEVADLKTQIVFFVRKKRNS